VDVVVQKWAGLYSAQLISTKHELSIEI